MRPESPDRGRATDRLRFPGSRRMWLGLAVLVILAGAGLGGSPGTTPDPADPPAASTPGTVPADTTAVPHRVLAYYFHTTYRCASCRKIEAYAREAIETGFSDALSDGRLVWQVVNVETKGNEHFVEDYRLYTKSVVLVDQRSGREDEWKNLEMVWQLLGNKQKFMDYVQTETRDYLVEKP
jgi:hypothetical protein